MSKIVNKYEHLTFPKNLYIKGIYFGTIIYNDKLEKFKKKYNEVKNELHQELMKKNITLFMYIAYKNKCGKITDYILEDYQITYRDICYLIYLNYKYTKNRVKNKELIKKYCLEQPKEIVSKLINCLAYRRLFDIVHYLHEQGYRAHDHKHFVTSYLKHNSIDKLLEYKYKITDDLFFEYLKHPYVTQEYINQFKEHHNLLKTKNINLLFKHSNSTTLNFILKNYKIKKEALDYCIQFHNYEMALKLINEHKLKLTRKHLLKVYNIKIKKRTKSKRKIRCIGGRLRLKKEFRLVKLKDNHKTILELTKLFNEKTVQKYLLRIYPKVLFNRLFEVAKYLQENIQENITINKNLLKNIVYDYIKSDDPNLLKELFKLDIINPLYLHKNEICTYAFSNGKYNIVNFCVDEYKYFPKKLISSTLDNYRLRKQMSKINIQKTIDFAVKNEYKIPNILIKGICHHKSKKDFQYLLDNVKNIKMRQKFLDEAVASNKYGIANLYIDNKFYYRKKNMVTRYINKKCERWGPKISKKTVNYIIRKGGNIAIEKRAEIVDLLLKLEKYKTIIFLHKKFPLKFNTAQITDWIYKLCGYDVGSKYTHIIKLLNILEKEEIYSIKDQNIDINIIIKRKFNLDDSWRLSKISDNVIDFVKYFVKRKPNFKIDPNVFVKIFSEKYIKYLETLDVIPTREIFMQMLYYNDSENLWRKSSEEYIMKKYGYKLTRKDFHEYILHDHYWFDHDYCPTTVKRFFHYGIKLTPYTHDLHLDRHNNLSSRLLKKYNKVTPKVKEHINNKMKDWKDKVEVVEYQPKQDEIPDNLHLINRVEKKKFDNDNDAFIERVNNDE